MAVITISRQLESLGDDVARLVCEKLGYQYFDKKMMAQVGQEMGLADQAPSKPLRTSNPQGPKSCWRVDRQHPEDHRRRSFELDFRGSSPTPSRELSVANLMEIINAGYKKGNVVIVGRGGMAALQDKPDVLHVRIMAPLAVRIKRMVDRETLSPKRRRQQKIKARDAERRSSGSSATLTSTLTIPSSSTWSSTRRRSRRRPRPT